MASSPQLPDNIETRKEINLEITQSCLDNGGHYIAAYILPRLSLIPALNSFPSKKLEPLHSRPCSLVDFVLFLRLTTLDA